MAEMALGTVLVAVAVVAEVVLELFKAVLAETAPLDSLLFTTKDYACLYQHFRQNYFSLLG